MTDGQTTITVSKSTLERFNDLKSDANDSTPGHVPEPNADLFLQSLMDTWDAVDSETDTPVDYGELPAELEAISEQLDRIESDAGSDVDYVEIQNRVEAALKEVLR